jgi:cysteate synthase
MEIEGVLMGNYVLRCLEGHELVDESYTLTCSSNHKGLLRTEYSERQLGPKSYGGIFKFFDWLPVHSVIKTRSGPVVFRNEKMSKELGLKDLWIGFTGYYPERGAYATSCSFKELEALPTYARLRDCGGGTILLASAGNTARAFAQVAEDIGERCIIVVPKKSQDRLNLTKDTGRVRLFTVDGDYTDAIQMSDRIAALGGFVLEGGAKNVARRDGMGTVMLEGVLSMGRIPDHYFQAVGSGTGGIAAWEASLRLIKDGRFGNKLPILNLAQNMPFAPMVKAWNAGRKEILPEDLGNASADENAVYADVLTNRKPPYGIRGGVFDAMTDCKGRFLGVSNSEARSAEKLWCSFESVRPDPAASVALASLIKSMEDGSVSQNDKVFLNMTGGGLDRAKEELGLTTVKVKANLDLNLSEEGLRGIINE